MPSAGEIASMLVVALTFASEARRVIGTPQEREMRKFFRG